MWRNYLTVALRALAKNRDGKKVVTLRFDASHLVGESAMDPKLVAEGRPYYNWNFGHLGDDMAASLRYLQRRFKPAKRVLVSVSLSAIRCRPASRSTSSRATRCRSATCRWERSSTMWS